MNVRFAPGADIDPALRSGPILSAMSRLAQWLRAPMAASRYWSLLIVWGAASAWAARLAAELEAPNWAWASLLLISAASLQIIFSKRMRAHGGHGLQLFAGPAAALAFSAVWPLAAGWVLERFPGAQPDESIRMYRGIEWLIGPPLVSLLVGGLTFLITLLQAGSEASATATD